MTAEHCCKIVAWLLGKLVCLTGPGYALASRTDGPSPWSLAISRKQAAASQGASKLAHSKAGIDNQTRTIV